MRLSDYFRTDRYHEALERYGDFVTSEKSWPVPQKLRLYAHAEAAFGEKRSRHDFEQIYKPLRAYWQVFRNAEGHWSSDELFDFLTSESVMPNRRLSLRDPWDESTKRSVQGLLDDMKPLKRQRSGKYPWMAVSKFLHFFNPKGFPIFDDDVIWNRVNNAFRPTFKRMDVDANVPYSEYNGSFNLAYTMLAGRMIQERHPRLMDDFVIWFSAAAQRSEPCAVPSDLSEYYATAFEFISIGAALIEGY